MAPFRHFSRKRVLQSAEMTQSIMSTGLRVIPDQSSPFVPAGGSPLQGNTAGVCACVCKYSILNDSTFAQKCWVFAEAPALIVKSSSCLHSCRLESGFRGSFSIWTSCQHSVLSCCVTSEHPHFSHLLRWISWIVFNIWKTVSAFLKTIHAQSKTPWITCKTR